MAEDKIGFNSSNNLRSGFKLFNEEEVKTFVYFYFILGGDHLKRKSLIDD